MCSVPAPANPTPVSKPSRGGGEGVPEPGAIPSQALVGPPLLGVLAAVAAIIDLFMNHGAVRTLTGTLGHARLLDIARWGQLPKNLAAVAGFVALATALAHFLSAPRRGRVARGLGLAGFGGIFLPIVAVATILPPEFLARRWSYLIVFAVGAGYVLTILSSTTAARRPGPGGLRIATMLLGGGCFLSFAAMALANIEIFVHTAFGHTVKVTFERAGELAWLLVPFSAATAIVPRPKSGRRAIVALALGGIVAVLIIAGGVWAKNLVHEDFGIVVYGMVGGELFVDALPSIYVLQLAVATGVAVTALVTREEAHVQAGAALLLLASAGFAPRAPLRLLVMVLGACMLARASIVFGERLLVARQKEEEEKQDERERASLAELDRSLSDPPEGSEAETADSDAETGSEAPEAPSETDSEAETAPA